MARASGSSPAMMRSPSRRSAPIARPKPRSCPTRSGPRPARSRPAASSAPAPPTARQSTSHSPCRPTPPEAARGNSVQSCDSPKCGAVSDPMSGTYRRCDRPTLHPPPRTSRAKAVPYAVWIAKSTPNQGCSTRPPAGRDLAPHGAPDLGRPPALAVDIVLKLGLGDRHRMAAYVVDRDHGEIARIGMPAGAAAECSRPRPGCRPPSMCGRYGSHRARKVTSSPTWMASLKVTWSNGQGHRIFSRPARRAGIGLPDLGRPKARRHEPCR